MPVSLRCKSLMPLPLCSSKTRPISTPSLPTRLSTSSSQSRTSRPVPSPTLKRRISEHQPKPTRKAKSSVIPTSSSKRSILSLPVLFPTTSSLPFSRVSIRQLSMEFCRLKLLVAYLRELISFLRSIALLITSLYWLLLLSTVAWTMSFVSGRPSELPRQS